jgi:hypothetical protein
MPAIDPERLKIEVDRVLDALGQPVELQKRSIELLEFYSDRTLKSIAIGEADEAYLAFGAPKPVMRALSFGFRSRLAQVPSDLFPAAAALWEAGYRETRILATVILGEFSGEEVPNWAERWASGCDDPLALSSLASQGLESWRRTETNAFLTKAEKWLGQEKKDLQVLALLALESAIEDPSFEDLPTVIRLIEGTSDKSKGSAFQALVDVLLALAKRSPPEAARFLLDELKRFRSGSKRLIQSTTHAFPPPQRDLLERALSHKNQTGIMRKP